MYRILKLQNQRGVACCLTLLFVGPGGPLKVNYKWPLKVAFVPKTTFLEEKNPNPSFEVL